MNILTSRLKSDLLKIPYNLENQNDLLMLRFLSLIFFSSNIQNIKNYIISNKVFDFFSIRKFNAYRQAKLQKKKE